MLRKTLLTILTIALFAANICNANAERRASLVLLNFSDNSNLSNYQAGEVLRELLLDRLFSCPDFVVVEKTLATEDVLAAENRLLAAGGTIPSFSEIFDFDAEKKDLCQKNLGEFVSAEDARLIGKNLGADYLLHCSIDYLGKEKDSLGSPLGAFGLDGQAASFKAIATVRLIEATTGKIIWLKREDGVAKTHSVAFREIAAGKEQQSNQLLHEALEKTSEQIFKSLEKDVRSNKIEI